jgi:hypothetical protein
MLQHSGQPCDVVICSFAIAEGWIKRLWKQKKAGRIKSITVVLDYSVMVRHREKLFILENVVDRIFLNNTHAKLILVESPDFSAVAVLSANATMNYRVEAFYVTNNPEDILTIKRDLEAIYDNSRSIITGKGTGGPLLHDSGDCTSDRD